MADVKRKLKKIQTVHGTIQGAAGILEAIFGTTYGGSGVVRPLKTIQRDAHQRRVEIGGPTTSVEAATFTSKRYIGNANGGPRGGEPVSVKIGVEWWEVRISMSHDHFSEILIDHSILPGEIFWNSQRGSSYGPLKTNPLP